jgi:hypothetical protein
VSGEAPTHIGRHLDFIVLTFFVGAVDAMAPPLATWDVVRRATIGSLLVLRTGIVEPDVALAFATGKLRRR